MNESFRCVKSFRNTPGSGKQTDVRHPYECSLHRYHDEGNGYEGVTKVGGQSHLDPLAECV